jgi:hypothetical protein
VRSEENLFTTSLGRVKENPGFHNMHTSRYHFPPNTATSDLVDFELNTKFHQEACMCLCDHQVLILLQLRERSLYVVLS